MEVASPEGWYRNQALVQDFYNQRRRQALECQPNLAHFILASLEEFFEVDIITQNVDNLHEKAGSTNVIHLHGELNKIRSVLDDNIIYEWDATPIKLGDTCKKGGQLRPHIVWFGEAVPMMEIAAQVTHQADIFMVVGTSLNVYPAAGLLDLVGNDIPKYIIDPNMPRVRQNPNLHLIEAVGSIGVPQVAKELIATYK
jgi:NAD-dependent deacetylase